MTSDDRIALRRKRSDAIQQFLDANAELFSPQMGEYENEDDLEDEAQSGIYVTGAILVIRARDLATGETEFSLNQSAPFAMGITEKIGMLEYALDQIR